MFKATAFLHVQLMLMKCQLPVVADDHLAAALQGIGNREQLAKFAQRIEKESSEDERQTLVEMLLVRREATPRAVEVLRTVHARGRRLQSASCSDMSEEACKACPQCHVPYANAGCWKKTLFCDDYKTEAACCANANGVENGCFWNAAAAKCNDMKCDRLTDYSCSASGFNTTCPAAEQLCGTMAGCHYTCAGCKETGFTCECSGSGTACSMPGVSNALTSLIGMMSCPVMDCALCLKGSQGSLFSIPNRTLTEMQASRLNECNAKCGNIVHCDDEVECLVGKQAASPPSAGTSTGSCPAAVVAQPSCQSTMPSTTTDASSASYSDCGSMCTAFDQGCTKSCGAACVGGTAGAVSAAFQQQRGSQFLVLVILLNILLPGLLAQQSPITGKQ